MNDARPWQLEMFDRTLKKKMKVAGLAKHLGDLRGKRCFMVSCGDNNGALNWKLRELGGEWTWAEFEEGSIPQIEELLAEPVARVDRATCELPGRDGEFDRVVVIDTHEHLEDPVRLTKELARITKPDGKVVVSVPNGDERMLAVRIKNLVGMTKEKYGHLVTGYNVPAMARILREAGLVPGPSSSYSKFFTEMLELGINFVYVMFSSRKGDVEVAEGTIAPTTREQVRSVEKQLRLYGLVYPVFRLVSALDAILWWAKGYAILVEATPAPQRSARSLDSTALSAAAASA
jgi:2-polyprenyl-3-methyl-5-hydroxy-6-metoxy-1,4-benzoquinol methylase